MNEWLDDFKAGLKSYDGLAQKTFARLCESRDEYGMALDIDNVVSRAVTQDMKTRALLFRDKKGRLVPWRVDDSLFLGKGGKDAEGLAPSVKKIAHQIKTVVNSSYWGGFTASAQIVNGMERVTTRAHGGLPDALHDFAETFEKVRRATKRGSQKEIGLALQTLFGRFDGKGVPWEALVADLATVLSAHYAAVVSTLKSENVKKQERFSPESLEQYRKRYRSLTQRNQKP